jgi:predicted enzyme related to lactoylglutathione lyase
MHKSKLAGFIIDCRTKDLRGAAEFWAAALGMEIRSLPGEEGEKYMRLLAPTEPLHIEVQTVDHESRVHLDIGADDIEAEANRLEKLGATRVARVHDWIVMQAPTGQRFCVVPARSKEFLDQCHIWQ